MCFCKLNTLGPLRWQKVSLRLVQISRTVSLYMILAWILGETELMIQVPTILLAQIQAWIAEGESTNGDEMVKEPSMNPNLFLEMSDFLKDVAQAG